MAGRGLYDNQTTIRAIPKIDTNLINLYPSGLLTIGIGQTITHDIIANENIIMQIENIYFNVAAANTKGAASGNFEIVIDKWANNNLVGVVAVGVNFDGALSMYYGTDLIVPAKKNYMRPAVMSEFLEQLKSFKFDTNNFLRVKLINNTNIVLTDLACLIKFSLTEQVTS